MKTKFVATVAFGLAALAGLLGAPRVASADTSPLLLSVPADGFSINGSLTVQTSPMPKGWFTGNQNTFDRTKTYVLLNVVISASDCSTEVTLPFDSRTSGAFTAVTNPQGKPTAYYWSITVPLSAYQDHWHNQIHCDNTVDVVGCSEARVVSVTATAYDAQGSCRTYTNDSNQTVCASDSKSGLLASIQDPDQFDSCSEPQGCEIGACVSDCQVNRCGNASSCTKGPAGQACRDAITACHQCCECVCKSETAGCTPQSLCYTGSPGHPVCLSNQ